MKSLGNTSVNFLTPYCYVSYSLSGPSQAPSDFSVSALTSTSVRTSWQLPPAESWHGVILGFKLLYRIKDSSDPITSVTIAINSTLTRDVTGLGKYTEYEIQVLAFSSMGDGELSALRVVRTNEDGKNTAIFIKLAVRNRTLVSINSVTIGEKSN